MVNSEPGDIVQSVTRGLSILELVAAHQPPLRAQDVAALSGLHVATTYHLLNTLVHAGYLRKEDGTFMLASKVAELYSQYDRHLRPSPASLAAIHRLAAVSEETAYVSRWYQGDVTIAGVAEGRRAVRVTGLHVGVSGHAHARASGKVLLAFGPPDRLEEYLARSPLEPRTSRTIVKPAALRKELETIRKRRYSVDREEFVEGVCCLAAPVLDDTGTASVALTITVPATRFAELHNTASSLLMREAEAVTRTLVTGPA
jgi:IclR family transcriptional regulator, acetate operon repressor